MASKWTDGDDWGEDAKEAMRLVDELAWEAAQRADE